MNKSVCLSPLSLYPLSSIFGPLIPLSSILIDDLKKEADHQHTRDKHIKRDFEMKSLNHEPNKENTSGMWNLQEYWIRERQRKMRKVLQLRLRRREQRKEGRGKRGHLRNIGRGRSLGRPGEGRKGEWTVYLEACLDRVAVGRMYHLILIVMV